MQFLCFKPERSSLRFQFRHCPNNHPKKMLGFVGFLPASSDVFQKFLFGNRIVGFNVVSANTSAGSNELTYDSTVTGFSGIVFAKSIIASPNRAVRSSKS